ncbi:MAG: hypothetical protein H6831_07270 [Planctomycetes bacterium]|nr:hypothetical protein [Planctomycetota bacterium]MCB9904192.1 hypothetical protein [Planctomycetota bacterium]
MIRSSLHPAPALVLALAVGGSLAYLWMAPEESAQAAPAHDERAEPAEPAAPAAIGSGADPDAELEAEPDELPD